MSDSEEVPADTDTRHVFVQDFESRFRERFPNHVLTSYGASFFDYLIGNVQTAVVDEIVLMMETWDQTLSDAQAIPRFARETNTRDWEVAHAHIQELISEVRQYRTRGRAGHHATHTGTIPLED